MTYELVVKDKNCLLYLRDKVIFSNENFLHILFRKGSIAAVSATEAICERLFKAGGQVLTRAWLRLGGSRVELLFMTQCSAPRFGDIRGVHVETEANAGGGVGMKAAATGGAREH